MTADPFGALPVDRLAAITAAGEWVLELATARALDVAPGLEVVPQLAFDRAAAAIVRAAVGDALIVLGRRRAAHPRLRRYRSSTAALVARHTSCPVAVIGLLDDRPRPAAGQVTAVLDSRAGSLRALDFALRAAQGRGLDVLVLRVDDRGSAEFEAALDERTRAATANVRLQDRGLASATALLAESGGAPLVVLSEEVPRSIRRAFFGGVGSSARRAALGPVVLVRKGQ